MIKISFLNPKLGRSHGMNIFSLASEYWMIDYNTVFAVKFLMGMVMNYGISIIYIIKPNESTLKHTC